MKDERLFVHFMLVDDGCFDILRVEGDRRKYERLLIMGDRERVHLRVRSGSIVFLEIFCRGI